MNRVVVTSRTIPDAAGELVVFDAGRGVANKPFQGQGRETWLMDAQAARTVIAAFGRLRRGLVIDYEHQTIDRAARPADGTAPAAGWIKALRWDAERGLVASVDWTARAADLIAKREYVFHSPVFNVDDDGRVCELLHAALTNNPATLGARPIAAIAAKRRSLLENTETQIMSIVAAKHTPDDSANGLSPLEQFRDCAMAALEVMQRRGVDLADRTKANASDVEAELAAEVRGTFSEADARALDALCGFVGRHATELERADVRADRETDDQAAPAALSRRDGKHPYERAIDKIVSERGVTRLVAMRAARAETPQLAAAYRQSRRLGRHELYAESSAGGDGPHAYELKIDEVAAADGCKKLVAMRKVQRDFPDLFAAYRRVRSAGKRAAV